MSTYIQNFGITKTLIKKNKNVNTNEIKWVGNYDGNQANINVSIDDNGSKDTVHLQLSNDDLMNLLGVQSIETSLEQRLINDFMQPKYNEYKPTTLDGIIAPQNHTKSIRRRKNKHRKSSKRNNRYY